MDFIHGLDLSFIILKTSLRLPVMLDGDKIAEALQSEAVFTVATDQKPIVATYGCGPCVAVGGYDPTNKIAFVVHFANAREVREFGEQVFSNISKLDSVVKLNFPKAEYI